MFSFAVLVPSPPILVPQLCGLATSPEVDPRAVLRAAVLAAAGALAAAADRWTVIGVADADRVLGPETVGTFAGFGADVRVGLSAAALTGSAQADPLLALPALIAGWLRGQVAPAVVAETRLVAADSAPGRCAELGSKLRAELDGVPEPHGVLVVADGAATLSTTAPGYLDERAAAVQENVDRALVRGDRAALEALDAALCAELAMSGRAAYQTLAGLFRADPADPDVETLYCDAPFGVGYHVGLWRPSGDGAA